MFVEDKNSHKSRSRKNSTNYCMRFPKIWSRPTGKPTQARSISNSGLPFTMPSTLECQYQKSREPQPQLGLPSIEESPSR